MKLFLYFQFLFLFIISILFPLAVNAYAGPGVAIGAIIVAITVLLTFIASSFISIINLIKSILKKV